MKNRGFIYTLVIIIIAGIAITMSTSRAIDKSRQQSGAAVATALEPETPAAGAGRAETEAELIMGAAAARAAAAEEAAGAVYDASPEKSAAAAEAVGVQEEAGVEAPSGEIQTVPESAIGPGMKSPDNQSLELRIGEASDIASNAGAAEAGADGVDSGTGKEAAESASIPLSPLEPAALIAENQGNDAAKTEGLAEAAAAEGSYHLNRLRELDVQIQKNREKQSAANNYSAKKMAENELKLWDNELNAIYGDIMDRLDVSQASSLVDEEREWMKERDRLAAEAAKASAGGSMESVEYTISLAESTRLRAYELMELYGHLLSE